MPNPLNDKLLTLDEKQVAKLYQNLFDSEEGQLVLEDLKNRCWFKKPLPYGEEGQRAEGARSTVLHIQTQIGYVKPQETESEE